MDKPYKLIWKFKNNNRYVQYHTYIFIGKVSSSIMSILNKIKELSLFESLVKLDKNEIVSLEKKYGEKWYNSFFNMYHISFTISQIKNNKTMSNELINKYGKEWYEKHIVSHIIMDRKILYSYNAIIKQEKSKLEEKKKRKFEKDDTDLDYKIRKNKNISSILDEKKVSRSKKIKTGGSLLNESEINGNFYNWNTNEFIELNPSKIKSFNNNEIMIGGNNENTDNEAVEETDNFNSGLNSEEEIMDEEDEIDLADIEKLYIKDDVVEDKDIDKTQDLIEKALDDDRIFKKNEKNLLEFNKNKDKSMNIEKLKNIYSKEYVKKLFIYNDDTVKKVKEKICNSILNNNKFGKTTFLLPSRQYLWSEYIFEDKINKVMIGHKWIRRNEILDIDIEPDNRIYMYEQLRDKLGLLKHNIKRYGGNKIRLEDDETNILDDYTNYITNNELYMIDVYNELGLNYSPNNEVLQNLKDVYLKLYFPNLKDDDISNILEYLNNNDKNEGLKLENVFDTITNDLILENEIVQLVEDVKLDIKKNKKDLFKNKYVNQSTIHINLRLDGIKKLDMYRIFNDFITDSEFPYIHYQTIERGNDYKYNEKEIYLSK
jgi:hypothetical protein